jgi:hypothetical protein
MMDVSTGSHLWESDDGMWQDISRILYEPRRGLGTNKRRKLFTPITWYLLYVFYGMLSGIAVWEVELQNPMLRRGILLKGRSVGTEGSFTGLRCRFLLEASYFLTPNQMRSMPCYGLVGSAIPQRVPDRLKQVRSRKTPLTRQCADNTTELELHCFI